VFLQGRHLASADEGYHPASLFLLAPEGEVSAGVAERALARNPDIRNSDFFKLSFIDSGKVNT